MDYFAYMLLKDGRTYFDRQSKAMDAMARVWFKVNRNRMLAKNLNEVWSFIQGWEAKRESLPYEIDGIVIKVDRTAVQTNWDLPARLRAGRLLINMQRAEP